MPELNVLLAAVICGGIGASILLLVVAVRGTVLDPTRPPNRIEALLERPRSPLLMLRLPSRPSSNQSPAHDGTDVHVTSVPSMSSTRRHDPSGRKLDADPFTPPA